jgi:hypothetical protein
MRGTMIKSAMLMAGASLLIIVGCLGFGEGTQTPTKFYVLHSLQSTPDEIPPIAKLPDISIGVGPVRIPQYLERPFAHSSGKPVGSVGHRTRFPFPLAEIKKYRLSDCTGGHPF